MSQSKDGYEIEPQTVRNGSTTVYPSDLNCKKYLKGTL